MSRLRTAPRTAQGAPVRGAATGGFTIVAGILMDAPFGGHEVGIGFSGTCDEAGAELEAIALAGKRSLRLAATLKLMRPA